MDVIGDSGCFVCGADNETGMKATFTVDREKREASTVLQLSARFQGWQGVIHGGIVATLLDEAAIHACRTIGERFVTAEATIRYLKPVPVDATVRVVGRVEEERKKLVRTSFRLEIDGTIHAKGEATVFRLS